jgi:hypothetical protein
MVAEKKSAKKVAAFQPGQACELTWQKEYT